MLKPWPWAISVVFLFLAVFYLVACEGVPEKTDGTTTGTDGAGNVTRKRLVDICHTPYGSCHLPKPFEEGADCSCPTGEGWIVGKAKAHSRELDLDTHLAGANEFDVSDIAKVIEWRP